MEVVSSQIPTPEPRHSIQGSQPQDLARLRVRDYHPLRWAVPGHFRLTGRDEAGPYNPTFPPSFLGGFGLGSSPLARRYLGNPVWFLFLFLLGCFRSEGFLSPKGVPQISSVARSRIKASPDRRLHAPTRSISLLATPFFSAQAKPSVRRRIMSGLIGNPHSTSV